jgi:hypothetical protein
VGACPGSGGREMNLRLYRALLLLYPRSFRREYCQPMLQLFGDCERERGAKVWLRTIPDLVRTVPILRLEAVMTSGPLASKVIAMALIALGTVVFAMGLGGPAITAAILFAVIGTLAIGRGALVPVFRGERAPLRYAVVQTWWAPIAALAGATLIFFGFGTIFEAHNWGGRIFGSTILMAFGFGMFLGLTRRPFARASGNGLILITTIPAFPVFWLVVPTVVALVIWVGVFTSGFDDKAVAPAS